VVDPGVDGNINGDNGRDAFVGWGMNRSGEQRALVFHADGTRVDLGVNDAVATGMNRAGIVVGIGQIGTPHQYAFAWYHGRVLRLPEPGWATTDAVQRINDRGDAAGAIVDRHGHTHPAVWIRLAFVRVLPIPHGFTDAVAHNINNRGELVGFAASPSEQVAWWWREDGTNGPLRPSYRGGFSEAWVVNSRGWAAGGLDYGGKIGLWPAVWRDGSIVRLGPTGPGVQFGLTFSGDEHGDYVGVAAYSPSDNHLHSFMTRIGAHVLYTLRPLSGNLADVSQAVAVIPHVGSLGTVVGGFSARADGSLAPTLWTCAWQQVIRPPAAPASTPRGGSGAAAAGGLVLKDELR
jgi:uncharacterized membrane protein